MFHFSWHVLWARKTLVSSVCLKKGMCHLYLHLCHPPGDSDSESVTIAFWLHLPTQQYIGCHGFTKSLPTQMTQTHIPSFIHFFLMKTQEWKDCYVHRNIGIRGSNAKYETGMKELKIDFVVGKKLWSSPLCEEGSVVFPSSCLHFSLLTVCSVFL